MDKRIEKYDQDISSMKEEIEQSQLKISDLDAGALEIQIENTEYVKNMQRKANRQESDMARLEKTKKENEKKTKMASETIIEKENLIHEKQTQFGFQSKQLEILAPENSKLKEEYKGLQEKIVDLQKQMMRLRLSVVIPILSRKL